MTGFDLSRLTETLGELPKGTPKETQEQPILEFIQNGTHGWDSPPKESPRDLWERKIGPENLKLLEPGGGLKSALGQAFRIRYSTGCLLSFEDKLRITHGSFIECQWNYRLGDDEGRYEAGVDRRQFDPNMRVFGKIRSSLWRYGYDKDWNTAAAAFNAIRNFQVPGFDVRMDWAIGYNEKGYAAYNRNLFLDGPLGFLLFHKGKHVLTVSFAVLKGQKIAITQIQLANKKGNRFLFGFDRKKEILKAFKNTFLGFSIWMITGPSAVATIEKSVDNNLAERDSRLKNARDTKEKARIRELYKDLEDKQVALPVEIAPRLLAFYPEEKGRLTKAGIYTFRQIHRKTPANPASPVTTTTTQETAQKISRINGGKPKTVKVKINGRATAKKTIEGWESIRNKPSHSKAYAK